MEKERIAVKSNHLIEASYKLTLVEQRVVFIGISKLFPKKPMKLQSTQRISAKEYAEIFDIPLPNAYRDIRDASNKLLTRIITTYKRSDGTIIDNKKYRKHQWLSYADYAENEGYVDITFHDKLSPYLTMLSGGKYTPLNLSQLSGIKSIYSIRMWELLTQYKKDGERFIMVNDLRKWFELEDKYKVYSALRRRVIEPAIKELEDKANLIISWDEIKKGRKVVGFDFMFEENQQLKLF